MTDSGESVESVETETGFIHVGQYVWDDMTTLHWECAEHCPHPNHQDARQRRYLDLLHEHGHIVCRSCESPLTTWDAADGWSCRACGRTDADE